MAIFEYRDGKFFYDNNQYRILSGAIHYFRVHPELWKDRLLKLKALGCNTVETYVAWNMHETAKGEYNFSGICDLSRFVTLAGEIGLKVIVRPGPFICAEWEFGGLPSWLLTIPGIRLRCNNGPWLEALENWFRVLLPVIEPLQCSKGGPVIMVQVENEYGAFGNDHSYLRSISRIYQECGINVPYFTSDQPDPHMLAGGTLPGALVTGNFGSRAAERFSILENFRPGEPKMCMEFWCGWFDHWQGRHHTRSADSAAAALREILENNGSVNFYMFHGGTNFGFMNGANCKDGKDYQPTITSYDYDALLSENGDITPKYIACRKVIADFEPITEPLPEKRLRISPSPANIDGHAPLLVTIPTPVESAHTLSMEQTGQSTGYILYRTTIHGPLQKANLELLGMHDRAHIMVDGKLHCVLYRKNPQTSTELTLDEGAHTLDILVENMGRANYGLYFEEQKGITRGVALNGQYLFNWQIFPLPFLSTSTITFTPGGSSPEQPAFLHASFQVDEPGDTWVDMRGFGKGVCFVNDFNLGRFWSEGPQYSLYIPSPVLRRGTNELVIFETEGIRSNIIHFSNEPVFKKENFFVKRVMNFFLSRI